MSNNPGDDENKRKILIAVLKLLVGMAIYGLVLAGGRSYATAAGVLLTFPALNGFALALSPPDKLAKTSRIMILLPIVNGILCAAYMFVFERAAETTGAVWLIVAVSLMWFGIAYFWGQTGGVPDRYSAVLAICLTAVSVGVTWSMLHAQALSASSHETTTWEQYFYDGRWRIALFAVCLSGVIGVTDYLIPKGFIKDQHAAALLGTLGAFPVVPFFGLWTIAANNALHVDARINTFAHMSSTVLLGPVVAVWYIYLLSSYLRVFASEAMRMSWLRKFGLAIAGWLCCFVVIAIISAVSR